MKKNNIIKNSKDFDRIIKKRNGISNKLFILNIEIIYSIVFMLASISYSNSLIAKVN